MPDNETTYGVSGKVPADSPVTESGPRPVATSKATKPANARTDSETGRGVEPTKAKTKAPARKRPPRKSPAKKSAAKSKSKSKETHAFGTCVPQGECPGHTDYAKETRK